MIEYSSPNTNKPLHLGHIRNNLLGYSVAQILRAVGHNVIKVNLVNDRGIHICKSMLAWKRYGGGETPASSGMKGDHLVGKYYVEFDKHYKAQVKELTASGMSEEEAKKRAPLMLEAQEMLRRWEARDPEVYGLWEMMNGWVYDGFDVTYKALGVDFDKVYYESQTYLLGKDIVQKGLDMGIFYRREDGSVWIDLTADGLDQKLLLRGDGTSVYMTQDLGTAYRRFEENDLDDMIYVVGNEQNYHFQVLKLVLKKLGYDWSDHITHLSYGMVELPNGKMKSREGTVVDADDLIDDMVRTAREMSDELGKLDDCTEDEAAAISRMVGLGALKYFILKVDPKKTMLFDPRESIDFNGNTGPFIQYTHARIRSVLRKAQEAGIACGEASAAAYLPEEVALVKQLADYPNVVKAAAEHEYPVFVANVDGQPKYIMALHGAGLWGPLWGYISVDSDKNTIYGADFSHQGETPGLGAEISKPAFSNEFKGKKLFMDGTFKSVAVVKPGKGVAGQDYVDGISGGTITSKGVDAMLFNSLSGYVKFLTSQN